MWQMSDEHIAQLLDLIAEYLIHEVLLSLHFMTPCFPAFLLPCWIILSSSFLSTVLIHMEYPQTLFLDYIFVFSMCLFLWLPHPLF